MTTTNNELGERVAVIETKLDSMQKDIQDLKKLFTDDYAQTKASVKDLQETVGPLTTLRRRLWTIYLVAVFSVGGILAIGIEYIKNLNK